VSARRRQIAGPPERSASAVWTTIADLVRDTLAPASEIDEAAARDEVMSIIGVARALISAGHLEHEPLTLIADPLRLDITVVSGTAATTLHENLNTVPGAATATDWTIHLPAAGAMAEWISGAVADSAHLTTEPPPVLKESAALAASSASGDFDAAALARLLGEEDA
jgi:hypothetical protein